MILMSQSEVAEYRDKDGSVFRFVPRTGKLERELLSYEAKLSGGNGTLAEHAENIARFIDKVLIGWSGGGLPSFPERPSDLLNMEEQSKILAFWHDSGKLSAEEKKG